MPQPPQRRKSNRTMATTSHLAHAGGRGKKTGGAAPGAFGVCGTRFEGPKLPASDLHLLYPNDRQMATAAGNTSGRGSSPYASTILRYVDGGGNLGGSGRPSPPLPATMCP